MMKLKGCCLIHCSLTPPIRSVGLTHRLISAPIVYHHQQGCRDEEFVSCFSMLCRDSIQWDTRTEETDSSGYSQRSPPPSLHCISWAPPGCCCCLLEIQSPGGGALGVGQSPSLPRLSLLCTLPLPPPSHLAVAPSCMESMQRDEAGGRRGRGEGTEGRGGGGGGRGGEEREVVFCPLTHLVLLHPRYQLGCSRIPIVAEWSDWEG